MYTAEISRVNPSCFLFLIDQSRSMGDHFVSLNKSKASALADAINKMLQQLVIKCAKSEGIRDYYHVGVIGYGPRGAAPAFSGAIAGRDLVPVSELAMNPARIEERVKKVADGAGGLVDMKIKFPIWFDPIADGATPMKEAFTTAHRIVKDWITQHPNGFPPVVINITDGESTDGDPSIEMNALKALSSSDGPVILFNLHAAQHASQTISFCGASTNLNNEYSKLLFNGSSPLPAFMKEVAKHDYQLELTSDARAFVLNGDIELLITAIDIGTRPGNLLR